MAVNVSDFDSVEEIDQYFAKKIRLAEPEEVADLESQKANTRVAFQERRLLSERLELAKEQAFVKYPHARQFPTMFANLTSPDAIEGTAKAVHEQQEKLIAEHEQKVRDELAPAAARAQYGSPTGGAGGGEPVSIESADEGEALKQRVWSRLQGGSGLQGGKSNPDLYRFTSVRFREALDTAQSNPSYKAEKKDDTRVVDARTERRRGA